MEDLVYPLVDCDEGHEVLALLVNDSDKIALVMCPEHQKILNLDSGVAIKEWLTPQQIRERGLR